MQKPPKIVVFLGPSLPLDKAKAILPDAIYLPPCLQSDLLSVATIERPNLIVLIDGVFGQSLSVWHKEILFALSQGIHVIGCSSMGAIRAAECEEFGMVGSGQIFRWYKDGVFENDDEVAVTHLEDGKPTSLPLVNVRETLNVMLADMVIDLGKWREIADMFESAYFPDRTIKLVPKHLRESFLDSYCDVKGKDAEITLKLVANHIGRYAKPFEPKFRMADCHLFDAQYQRDRRVKREDGEVPLSEIDSHLALHSEFFERTNWDANNRLAARVFAEVMQLNPSQEEIQSEANRFCCIHGITDDVKLGFWLENNDLSMSEFWDLMLENAKIHKLHKALHVSKVACRNTKTVLDHLRITGEYPSAADESAAMEMAINRVAPDFMHNPVSRQPIDELLSEHCQDTGIRISTDLQIWLREAGFHSENELRIDLARSRILRGKS